MLKNKKKIIIIIKDRYHVKRSKTSELKAMSLKTLENWKGSKNLSSQYTNEDRISKSSKTAFIAKPIKIEFCLYYFRGYGEQKAMPRTFIR